ncbi:hypothetical protein SAMN05421855_1047 [Ulvibacter litoralis]|uniref:Uncharacterized protein n=1 Tax=Ulvibacter litoralis TaxID=227084 RepID=A0A1G7HCD3_9FLAO|nr:hypothetical protein SAMN05421855_1047 [Ulvibacter litoralis]
MDGFFMKYYECIVAMAFGKLIPPVFRSLTYNQHGTNAKKD